MHQVPETARFDVFSWNLVNIFEKLIREYISRGFLRSLNTNITKEKAYDVPGARDGRFRRLLLEFSENL